MSVNIKEKTKLKYRKFRCLSNRDNDIIFVDKDTNQDYTLEQLGELGLEYLDTIEFKQDNAQTIKRVSIFIEV